MTSGMAEQATQIANSKPTHSKSTPPLTLISLPPQPTSSLLQLTLAGLPVYLQVPSVMRGSLPPIWRLHSSVSRRFPSCSAPPSIQLMLISGSFSTTYPQQSRLPDFSTHLILAFPGKPLQIGRLALWNCQTFFSRFMQEGPSALKSDQTPKTR